MRNQSRGITLVALVVTIIILIILAGVSINLVLGENGIITIAQRAKQNIQLASNEEQAKLANLEVDLGNMGGAAVEKSDVEKYRDSETYMTEKTTLKDSNGNLIKVPEGFKIAKDSGINVTEGIVIEDDDTSIDGIGEERGNQYVWVPVGTGIKKSDGTTENITLGRYTFANGTTDKAEDGTLLDKGTPILAQNIVDYYDEAGIRNNSDSWYWYYKELITYREGKESDFGGENATALSILNFKESVEENGGYYIARYEASYGTDNKPNSKVSVDDGEISSSSSSESSSSSSTEPIEEGILWNDITQREAAKVSRNLYGTSSEASSSSSTSTSMSTSEEVILNSEKTVTSDLINSYAWDTAIVYIQKFSGDKDYSYQDGNSINSSLTKTGVNNDERCKIHDMASNVNEWTTEYSERTYSSGDYPCTNRGGCFNTGYNYCSVSTGDRGYLRASLNNAVYIGFRVILYI